MGYTVYQTEKSPAIEIGQKWYKTRQFNLYILRHLIAQVRTIVDFKVHFKDAVAKLSS